ncbi:ribonuclease HI [Emcibacter sp.]|uniref:ribonuclease HI n=1 Tax=Emcibacter sp. TaxID=1979954 RepID=UPI003A9489F3
MKEVIAYTDGACSGNPGPGGWGVLLQSGTHEKELCGGKRETTNNQMELMAAIKALNAIKFSCHVTIYTDSTYVKDGITKWIHNWKNNGWRTAAKKPVKNAELWQKLDKAIESHNVSWKWVKGHSGHPGNEKADELARRGMSKYQ